VTSAPLSAAIRAAFRGDLEPLSIDDLVVRLSEGLLAADPGGPRAARLRHLDVAAIERARGLLEAEKRRVVRSSELERVTGLSRYDLARQFRAMLGTSPYRYLLMRRLADARAQVARGRPLVDIAIEAGFADQAHFTRIFSAAFGITPGRYGALSALART
jgi:AraC-like DNA-binding protein